MKEILDLKNERENTITLENINSWADLLTDRFAHVWKEESDEEGLYQNIHAEVLAFLDSLKNKYPCDEEVQMYILFYLTQDILKIYQECKEHNEEFKMQEKIKGVAFQRIMEGYIDNGSLRTERFSKDVTRNIIAESFDANEFKNYNPEFGPPKNDMYEWIVDRLGKVTPGLQERLDHLRHDQKFKDAFLDFFQDPKKRINGLLDYVADRVSRG